MAQRPASPIGTSVTDAIQENLGDPEYQAAQDEFRPFEEIARLVIMRRAQLGLTQRELARRMSTTASAISRIESGQHKTSRETLTKLAIALEGRAVFGFDFSTPRRKHRELIML